MPQSLSSDAEPLAAAMPADPAGDTPRRELEIRTSRQGPLQILHLAGALHASTVVTAEAQILSTVVLTPRPLHLALDLTEVTRIDSAGTALLAKARFAVHAARGTLHLVAPAGSPARIALDSGPARSARGRVERVTDIRLPSAAAPRAGADAG
ncbi:STAS domain-containing protein [Actinomadura sp. 21ATH]|uniref:STAS domain-containing protein n=1 Tax=Actinomadura sp. 21ATH TaxID=1735444 RepID=UPI0035C2547F